MSSIDPYETHTEIDWRFVPDWARYGIHRFEEYLASHAQFERYYAERDREPAA